MTGAADDTAWFRRFLLGAAAAVYASAAVELYLVGHVEGWQQWLPFGVVALGVAAVAWRSTSAGSGPTRTVRATAVIAVATSALGIGFHLWGNAAFAREVDPSLSLAGAAWESFTGGNPALAPGMVALAGVLSAAATYREPARGWA